MAFLALMIGVVLVVTTIRGTHTTLLTALGQDVPGFVVWGAAIFAVAVIGFIPGLKPVSRGLLALVILVIVLTNYKAILAGFQQTWKGAPAQAAGTSGQTQSWLSSLGSATGFDFSNLDLSSLTGTDNSGGSAQVNG